MLGFYNVSVILTYLSLVFASLGIAFSLQGGERSVFGALLCLMFSGLCDMFDGAVAQKCKRNEEEKMFGVQIDSLCDLIAFGVLPACIALNLAGGNAFSRVAATLIMLSSVIRLGYFNVQEIARDKSMKRKTYTGVPVTLISIFLPMFLLLNLLFSIPQTIFAPLFLCVFAALEISRLPLKKPYGYRKIAVLALGVLVFVLTCVLGTRIHP